jgi:hypothetical protein
MIFFPGRARSQAPQPSKKSLNEKEKHALFLSKKLEHPPCIIVRPAISSNHDYEHLCKRFELWNP